MTTKSKRNLPFKPTTEAPKGVPEDGQWWRTSSLDDATPDEWDRAACAAYADPTYGNNADAVACPVENPDHYNAGAIEAIEAIKASMPTEQFFGYLKGNVMKYLWRYDYKEKPIEDLRKADWYLNRLIDVLIEDNQ